MKLSDIMSAAGLSGFAEAALVLFMGVFVAICWSVFSKKNARRLEEASKIPLSDTDVVSPRSRRSDTRSSSFQP